MSRSLRSGSTIDGSAVKVSDVPSGALLATLQGHTANVLSVAFSSNGQKMATGSADGTARTWTVPLPPIPAATLQNITAAVPARATATPARPRRILVVWRADAILHKGGVPAVNHAIELMSKQTGAFEADFTRDAEAFDPSVLSKVRRDCDEQHRASHLERHAAQGLSELRARRRCGRRHPRGHRHVPHVAGGRTGNWRDVRRSSVRTEWHVEGEARPAEPFSLASVRWQGFYDSRRVLRDGRACTRARIAACCYRSTYPTPRQAPSILSRTPHARKTGTSRWRGLKATIRPRVLCKFRPHRRTVRAPGDSALLPRRHSMVLGDLKTD